MLSFFALGCPQTLTSGIVNFFNYICITHEYNDDDEEAVEGISYYIKINLHKVLKSLKKVSSFK